MLVNRTPFRIPLGGGGTDLPSYYREHGGFLITAGLKLYMHVCINEPAMVDRIKINYSKVEIVKVADIASIQHEIVREALLHMNICRPLEISSLADISPGTGLGSSGAYTVGLLHALHALLRSEITTQELAEEACKIEMERIGKPVGKQDPYAAAYGGIVALNIASSGAVEVRKLTLDPAIIEELEHRLLLFYTQKERSANDILHEQQKAIATQAATVASMHRIKQIGYQVQEALFKGDVDQLGELFHAHWMEKRTLTPHMSSPQIDEWYELAMRHGAIGGKIMGAGGSGFFVFCCERGKRRQLHEVLQAAGLKYTPFAFDFEGSKTLVNV